MYKIYQAIKEHASNPCVKAYMPGHKGSKDFNNLFPIATLDTTELEINGVVNAVKSAEEDLARLLCVPFLRLLCNGSTSGVLSIMYAVKNRGKKIIINKDAHRSIYNALEICGIEPIIIGGELENGLSKLITTADIKDALKKNTNVIGAFLTYPDYYGRCFDIESVSDFLQSENKLLLIDGAHGAHFNFLTGLKRAASCADFGVESAHKTLCSLNQGSYCYCKEEFKESLDSAVNKFVSSSPSYPILASIEYGLKAYDRNKAYKVIGYINVVKGVLKKYDFGYLESADPLKLTIDFYGYDIKSVMNIFEKKKIYAELVGDRYALFMFSTENEKKDFTKIIKAIKLVNKKFEKRAGVTLNTAFKKSKSVGFLTAKKAMEEFVPLENCEGRISKEEVGITPPSFPVIISGEIITKEKIDFLVNAFNFGKELFGVSDGKIKVVKDEK